MSSILVTGGAGYIGSHTCKRIAQEGFTPITFDNLSTGHASFVRWGPLVEGDLSNQDLILDTLEKYRPAAVLHFAASALVGESVENPLLYYHNNVAGTLSLLRAMLTSGVKNIIFSSSCATYGNPLSVPITESHPQNPISPYGRSKLFVEQILTDFSSAYDFRAVSLRYFNAAGADSSLQLGEDHNPETHLIPSLLEALAGKRPYCSLYGTDFETSDRSAVRDYVHVEDLAEAHFLALKWIFEQPAGHYAFNLGTGSGHSVLEVAKAVQSLSPKKLPLQMKPRRAGDPPFLTADASKVAEILGWHPTRSSLPEIVSSAWSWNQKLDRS